MILCIVPTWLWILKGFSSILVIFMGQMLWLLKRSLVKNYIYKPWLEEKVILHEKEHTQGSQVRYEKAS